LTYISTGFDYYLSCSKVGKVYGWGSTEAGRLGVNSENAVEPKPVLVDIDDFVIMVAAGSKNAISLALTISGWD
jgi:alpha-tubulin suppressor-like RCC1 family protein